MSTVESGPRDGHHEVRATHFVGQSCKAEESCFGTSYRAGDHGLSTAQQKSQWQSNTHTDPMHDEPFTMAALLLLLAVTVLMAGLVIGGVL
jgi:hypothetical protein